MKTSALLLLLLYLALGLAGCSSREARIKRSPELFSSLPAEQQEMVRAGRVGIGFSKDAVRLAVGDPDRIWTRTDAKGTNEVWSYTTWQGTGGEPLYTGWYHRYYGGYPLGYSPLYSSSRQEREYFKVVFGPDAKVAAIEQETR